MALTWEGTLNTLDPLVLGPILTGIMGADAGEAEEAALGDAPKFEIPSSYDDYTAMMKERTQQDMPGMDIMSDEIKGQAAANATGVGQLSSGPGAIMGASSVYNNQSNQLRDLGLGASQWEQEQQLGYMGAVQGGAELEQQQFEYNEWLPWQIAKNEIASIRNAGNQMVSGGTSGMATGAVDIVGASTSNVGK